MSSKALESKEEKIIQRADSPGLKILDPPGFKTEEIRVPFLDNLRYLMILLVLVYHACGAYTSVAPHWVVHDRTSLAADFIRELFDVFMMPLLFFIAGFFAPLSLEKKGTFGFLKDKVWRLLVPWALAVFIILPLAIYDQPINPVRPFWKFWPWYLGSFEVRLRYTPSPAGPTTQAIYWFISLLFAFFILYLLVHPLIQEQRRRLTFPVENKMRSGKSILTSLFIFGLLISTGQFLFLLLFPDSSWFTLHAFLEFQVTRLVPFAGSFAFGVYAQRCRWFSDNKSLGSLALWAVICGLLTVIYLLIGRPVFTDTIGKANFSVGFLLGFAFLRSFLLLSFLVMFVSFGVLHWNRSSAISRRLSATSYDIYLTHYWFIVGIQAALLNWSGGPVLFKVTLVFVIGLGLSYAISWWVLARHSRAFVVFFLALFVFCLAFRP
jgi:glucans biosynthesis protein C